MTRSQSCNQRQRRGIVALLTCFMLILLLGMVAFAVDLGYLANSQTELRRSADAAALASCYELLNQTTSGNPVNVAANVPNVPAVASQYASLNRVCTAPPASRRVT